MDVTRTCIEKANGLCKLTWQDLNYSVRVKDESAKKCVGSSYKMLDIVKKTSGYVMPGTANYILGSSGAGKTSLLNCLSNRHNIEVGKMTGTIMVNDEQPMTQSFFGNVGAYVMQDDILYSHMTVQEALTFAARMKLPDLTRKE